MRRYLMLALLLALPSAAAAKIKTDTKYDESHYFQYWESFDFKAQMRSPSSFLRKNPDKLEMIQTAITKELTDRGLSRSEDETVHFLVAFYGGVGHKFDARDLSYGIPNEWGEDFWQSGRHEGVLIIHFIDARSNQLVWRGTARDIVRPEGGDGSKIGPAVRLLVEEFMKDRAEREASKRER